MFTCAFNVRRVRADGAIYFKADGSVQGTAHIQTTDNVTYFFTSDIDGYVEVDRDNMILDGRGFLLSGDWGTAAGIWVNGRTNVTIRNLSVNDHYYSIALTSASNCTISRCKVSSAAIVIESSSNNVIAENNIEFFGSFELVLSQSDDNSIIGNTMNKGIRADGSYRNSILGNDIVGADTAILLDFGSSNNIVSGNNIYDNAIGVQIDSSSSNTIYDNNFINNTLQASIANSAGYSSINLWNGGYPSGGNYWSDYRTKYPHAAEIDSSGIWNTPYVIDANNTDYYPLENETAQAFPIILILSPESMIYNMTNVPLTFTVDQTTSWTGYSLDGQSNTTVSGNTTLTNLAYGIHNIIIFANSTTNVMGASSIIFFRVEPIDITNVSQNPPATNVYPTDVVSVNATITDSVSTITQVSLNYTNGNGTWITANMTNLQGNMWNSTIPQFPGDAKITYVITVSDNAGNTVTTQQLGYTFQYWVVPEFTALTIVFLLILVTLPVILIRTRKRSFACAN